MSNRSELSNQNQNSNDHEGCAGCSLNPFQGKVLAQRGADDNTHCGYSRQPERCAKENFPWPFLLSGHGHCGQLSLVTHLPQKHYSENKKQSPPIHVAPLSNSNLIAQIM